MLDQPAFWRSLMLLMILLAGGVSGSPMADLPISVLLD
jgi:hypothetical protein